MLPTRDQLSATATESTLIANEASAKLTAWLRALNSIRELYNLYDSSVWQSPIIEANTILSKTHDMLAPLLREALEKNRAIAAQATRELTDE